MDKTMHPNLMSFTHWKERIKLSRGWITKGTEIYLTYMQVFIDSFSTLFHTRICLTFNVYISFSGVFIIQLYEVRDLEVI